MLTIAVAFGQQKGIKLNNIAPEFSLTGGNTFLRNHPVSISGFHAGVKYIQKIHAGVCYAFLPLKVDETIILDNKKVTARLNYYTIGLYGEYDFFGNNKWVFAAGFSPAFGEVYNVYNTDRRNAKYVFTTEPYLSGAYKIHPALGISARLGYRLLPLGALNGTSDLNAPVFSIGFNAFLSSILGGVIHK